MQVLQNEIKFIIRIYRLIFCFIHILMRCESESELVNVEVSE
jgi:hypothetical protein